MSIYSWTMYKNQSVLLYKSKLEFLSLFMSHLSFKTRSRKLNLCIEAKHILGIYGKHLGWDSLMKTLNPKIRRRQHPWRCFDQYIPCLFQTLGNVHYSSNAK
jgi:hypothetical protein